MMRLISRAAPWLGALLLAGCAGNSAVLAPAPAKPIDVSRFYTGRWYEIARTPMSITDGCVAGTTDYWRSAQGGLVEFDACHKNTPMGAEKSIKGPARILNPGQNTKLIVHYTVFHVIPITRRYWMLDHGADYDWFIETDPGFKYMSIFTRNPRPAPSEVAMLTARARALGYDTSKLEYPAQFPPGLK